MQYFSEEYRQQLINEHKLISASIAQLSDIGYARYARSHGVDTIIAALSQLKTKKVELEAMIDVINEYVKN